MPINQGLRRVFIVLSVVTLLLVGTTFLHFRTLPRLNVGVAQNSSPIPRESILVEQDFDVNGVRSHIRLHSNRSSDILFLVLNHNAHSWGKTADSPNRRTVYDFLRMLEDTKLDLSTTSLGVLTSDATEYETILVAAAEKDFARLTVIQHPGYPDPKTVVPDGEDRHSDEVQKARRRAIARLRNYLMFTSLGHEQHILWVDSDVAILMPDIVQTMMAHSNAKPEAGIITARCQIGGIADYDTNAWAGPRLTPNAEELAKIDAGELWVPREGPGSKHVGELAASTPQDQLFRLDAVGGTILYVRAELARQGVGFATSYLVGTTWDREGWDGIESEGICLTARALGAGCFGLGGEWQVWHTDDVS